MFKWLQCLAVCAGVALALPALAHSFKLAELEIIHPYARPTTPGIQNGAAWFGVKNTGQQADRVIGVHSDRAKHAEIHDMTMENDVMRMFKVDGVEVPAGETVVFGDGNKLHVMLLELAAPLQVGDKFTLTLEFEKAGSLPVEVWVEAPKGQASSAGHAHHH